MNIMAEALLLPGLDRGKEVSYHDSIISADRGHPPVGKNKTHAGTILFLPACWQAGLWKHRFLFMKTKAQKQTILQQLEEQIAQTPFLVLVDVSGLAIKDLSKLRAMLKQTGAKLQVAKKTLLQKALEKSGVQANLKTMAGEIAAIFSQDPLKALKLAHTFSKTSAHLKLRAAYLEGTMHQNEALLQLAQLPGREELLSQLLRTLVNPVAGLMNVMQGNTKGLIRVLAQAKTA